jgi:hypothetical protein
MLWVGIVLMVLSFASLAFGLWESFISEGGAIGQVPVLMHAVAFPLLLTMAVRYLRAGGQSWADFPVWILVVAFPVLVLLSGFLIAMVGNMGERYHRRKR